MMYEINTRKEILQHLNTKNSKTNKCEEDKKTRCWTGKQGEGQENKAKD